MVIVMLQPNRLSHYIHNKMKYFGYYKKDREKGTILLLIVGEIVKLYDENTLNKAEKLADITMRLYDYCGQNNIKIKDIDYAEYDAIKMISCINNEYEAFRSDVETNHCYIKQCLAMCYSYAQDNDIDINREIFIKMKKLHKYTK